MNDMESVRSLIKKILRLSKSPNENEAAAAIAKANNLIEKYGIDEAEIADYTSATVKTTRRYVEWRSVLANAVEQLYATYHFRDKSSGTFVFFGEELDVFMSTQMYSYLEKTVDRMASLNIPKNAKFRYRQSYKTGAANRIYERIERLGKECCWRNYDDLTEKKKEIAEWVSCQHELTHRTRTSKPNMKAYMKGFITANDINLSRQMTGSGGRRIVSQ